MSSHRLFRVCAILCLAIPAAASAQSAFTNKDSNLRAGPSRDYPIVAQIPAGTAVQVEGCLNDWSWCDVIPPSGDRGWIYAGHLDYPYEGGQVEILEGGVFLGLPIVTFSIGPYWDSYYRGRPWYERRGYWVGRPPAPHWRGVVRPRPVVIPPPGHRPAGWHPPGWHVQGTPGPRPVNVRPGNAGPRTIRPVAPPKVVRPVPPPKRPQSPPKKRGPGKG